MTHRASRAVLASAAPSSKATGPRVTPAVRQIAHQVGVDLATVKGTGVGGRISARDVRQAAGFQTRPRAAAAQARPRPSLFVEQRSYWTLENRTVSLDVYASNPLVDDMRANAPEQYAAARSQAGDPPTLFSAGDLPLFTASGMDPALLMQLPWMARPAAAAASAADASEIFELYGAVTKETWEAAMMAYCLDSPVLTYENRMRAWGAAGV